MLDRLALTMLAKFKNALLALLQFQRRSTFLEPVRRKNKAATLADDAREDLMRLGRQALSAGDFSAASEHFNRAVLHSPHDADARVALSFGLVEQMLYAEAKPHLNRALLLAPANADAYFLLGKVCLETGNAAEAIENFNHALDLNPDSDLLRDVSRTLFERGLKDQAYSVVLKGIALFPASADFHNNLGLLKTDQRRFDEAMESFEKALAIDPNSAEIHSNVGFALIEQGQVDLAVSSLQRALALSPDHFMSHDNLLWGRLFQAQVSSDVYLAEARKYGDQARAKAVPYTAWAGSNKMHSTAAHHTTLRVGLVSGDFRTHALGFLLEGILPTLNPAKIELVAYSMNPQDDDLTARIRRCFSQWTSITKLSDEVVAHKIHEDRVDILIDLAGHSRHNRLPIFAWKPAPVQLSWLGYLASTGVPGMDYVLADRVSVPEAAKKYFSEKIWYLPETFNCFVPPMDHPKLAVAMPPALRNGRITFGSFQRMNKLSDLTLALWGRILRELPNATLRLQNEQLGDPVMSAGLRRKLTGLGIASERVTLAAGGLNRHDYLSSYANVDIALDTYPYPGVTTTCEALWMGVPTVTLCGETMLQRIGASLLTCVGLAEWVAQSEDEYVSLAVKHGSDVEGLARLRAGLRQRAAATPLFDVRRFAPQFEDALFAIWRHEMERPESLVPTAPIPKAPTPSADSFRDTTPAQLGSQALANGDLALATEHYRQAALNAPDDADAQVALGYVLAERGLYQEARPCFERALQINPANADAYYLLGTVFQAANDLPAAIDNFNAALKFKPDFEVALRDLSRNLFQNGQKAEAKEAILRGISMFPESADFHLFFGNVCFAEQAYQRAIDCYQKALAYQPDRAELHYNIGHTLVEALCFEQALPSFDRAVALDSEYGEAYIKRGNALIVLKRHEAALESYRAALRIKPADSVAMHNIGYTYIDQGQIALSVASFRSALAINPDHFPTFSSLLFSLSFCSRDFGGEYLAEAKRYGERVAQKALPLTSASRAGRGGGAGIVGSVGKRLRVGLVSGDLRAHPVGFCIESVLANVNPARLELMAYSMNPQDDSLTERIKRRFVQWTSIEKMSDEDVARKIHEDGIDILIDLVGHSAHNRLPVFAWKPAPVQVSWLGYMASTGVPGIDYVLADPVSVPEECRDQFTEEVWHLPETLFCFTPPGENPKLAVVAPPALGNGYITFGSFQRLNKLSDVTLALWGRIFKALPEARLCLRNNFMGTERFREQLMSRLEAAGIESWRVVLEPGIQDRVDYLASYAGIDLVLDTFPHPGATTTCEALWMGVPTVTLVGTTMLSRIGASLLTCARLKEWVASSEDEYVELAVTLATDVEGLARLRAGLRQQVAATTLFDAKRFALGLEDALVAIWMRKAGAQENLEPPAICSVG